MTANNASRPVLAALVGGLLAGASDFIGACLAYSVPPSTVARAVARGWYGKAAMQGGTDVMAVGVASHFMIAILAAAVYVAASRRLAILTARPVLAGAAFGLAVFFFMHLVVLPLSAMHTTALKALSVPMALDILSNIIFGVVIGLVTRLLAGRPSRA